MKTFDELEQELRELQAEWDEAFEKFCGSADAVADMRAEIERAMDEDAQDLQDTITSVRPGM